MICSRWLQVAFLAAFAIGVANSARAAATDWVGDKRGTVRLLTATDSVDSDVVEAGVEFRYPPGWHGYWRTPGDAGIAPVINWSASKNLRNAAVSWPAPSRLVVDGLQSSIYEGQFILPVKLSLMDPHASTHLAMSIEYASCANICVPKHAVLSLDLPAGRGGASPEASDIAAARSALPATLAASGIELTESHIEGTGQDRRLVVALESAKLPFHSPDLFVEGAGIGLPPAPIVQFGNQDRTAKLNVPLPANAAEKGPLTLTLVDGTRSAEFSGPEIAPRPLPNGAEFPTIVALALVGGLILNLMPCVLPILSVKLFALARHAGARPAEARYGAIATTLGILASFLVLAIALVGLKLSGATLGWGIQFQQPWFLASMALVTTLFAASFFEWLPIRLPHFFGGLGLTPARGPIIEAFLFGAFATLLATPCSAPFVGTAVGFALARGPAEILIIFFSLGVGMAMPFMVVAVAPRLVTWLPRPGTWMVRLRQGLGLLLLATTLWLLSILWSVTDGLVAGTVAGLLAAMLCFQALMARRDAQTFPGWVMLGFLALTILLVVFALPTTRLGQAAVAADDQRSFDPAAIDTLVVSGKTVWVDVTASWCLTCKVNELTLLSNTELNARLRRPDVVRMRADWSRPDPTIAAYVQRFGRFGIPLDVVYGPRQPQGETLPEILTAKTLLDALDTAGRETTASADRNSDPYQPGDGLKSP